MSNHPNAKLMRAAYDAYSRGDIGSLADAVRDDFVYHVPGRSPLAGDYRGLPAVVEFWSRQFELTASDHRVVPERILADDQTGVALIRVSGTRGARRLDTPGVNVVRFQDGNAAGFWSYAYDQHAVDEFWA